jgi:hypothetical protein
MNMTRMITTCIWTTAAFAGGCYTSDHRLLVPFCILFMHIIETFFTKVIDDAVHEAIHEYVHAIAVAISLEG